MVLALPIANQAAKGMTTYKTPATKKAVAGSKAE
jgi:hypothetical protein